MSLVETLAAAVLVTLLAAATVPVLRQSAVAPEPADIDLIDLDAIANEAIAEGRAPGAFSPDDRPEVTVVMQTIPSENGLWVSFSCAGLRVFRWMPDP